LIVLSIGPDSHQDPLSLRLLLKKSDELLHCVQPDCQTTAQHLQTMANLHPQDLSAAGLESRLSHACFSLLPFGANACTRKKVGNCLKLVVGIEFRTA